MIPPGGGFETARYGDRPFPVVPVDYSDRAHDVAASTASKLASKINDPANPGSTFNLYQEISYGQLFPHADRALGRDRQRGLDRDATTSPRPATPRAR